MKLRLLLIEDSEEDARLLVSGLLSGGFDPDFARIETREELETALAGSPWDAVIADCGMPAFTGLDALRIIQAKGLDLPVLLISGAVGEETIVDAIKAGAHDYIMKENLSRVAPALERELREREVRRERRQAKKELQRTHDERETRLRQQATELAWTKEALRAETYERKRVEEELRTLSRGIEQSPVSIVITDREGSIEYVNPKFTRLTGYTATEAIARTPRILKSGKTPADVYRQLWETILSGNEWHGEFCNRKKNGDLYWESASISPVVDTEGNITRFIAVKEDITERKRMEEVLAKQIRFMSLRAEVGSALDLNLDLRGILQRCAELLVEYLGVPFFRIWTLNDAEQVLELQASAGMYTHINGPHGRVPVGMFKIGLIASERQPHLTNDVLDDPRVGDKEWARLEGMIAFAGYPLIVADRLVGVMATFSRSPLTEKILGELGSIAGWIAQCIERIRAEEEVNFKNSILSAQQECTIDGILVVDDTATIISCNRRFTDMWRILPEVVDAGDYAPLLRFVAQQLVDSEGFLARIKHLHEHREEQSREELALKDGRVFDRYSASLLGADGKYYGRLWSFRDITDRKHLEMALRNATDAAKEYAQRLELALEGSDDGAWEWDIISDQGFLNTRYYEMTGYTPGEVVTNFAFFKSTIHPDDVAEVEKQVRDHLEGKKDRYSAQYRMVTKSGRIRAVMGRGKVVMRDDDGKPTRMAGVVTDVTEQKRLADEVNRIHNLESIGILAGGLAHDFNNVLNIICGNISFAKMLAEGNTAVSEPLADAEEACERARELGIRLQFFSQGSSPLKEPIKLHDIVNDAAETLFKDSGILHTVSAAADLLPVEADPRQIRQLFDNLFTNAKETMSAGGTIRIGIDNHVDDGTKAIPLGSGRYLRIAIQDNGAGIPKQHLPKIFDPYFSTKDTYSQKGMGLGLSICHAILKKHKGHISVDSELGVGTRVSIYLPAAEEDTEPSAGTCPVN